MQNIMHQQKTKFERYAPLAGPLLALIIALVSASFTISDRIQIANTTNLIQNQRIEHLEQQSIKNNEDFNELRSEMNAGFERIYQTILQQQKK